MAGRFLQPNEIEEIRLHCEDQFHGEVKRLAVVTRNFDSEVGVMIEMPDGWRHAVVAVLEDGDEGSLGPSLVDALRDEMRKRRGKMS